MLVVNKLVLAVSQSPRSEVRQKPADRTRSVGQSFEEALAARAPAERRARAEVLGLQARWVKGPRELWVGFLKNICSFLCWF